MTSNTIKRTLISAAVFGVLFFLLNYFSGTHHSITSMVFKSLLSALVFGILYLVLFSIVNSPERKYKFGITIPIALIITIIVSAIFSALKVGIVVGLILGVVAGYIWEYIEKKNGSSDK